MPRLSRAGRPRRHWLNPVRQSGAFNALLLASCVCLASTSSCGFPNYAFNNGAGAEGPAGSAGAAAGNAGDAGSGGVSGSSGAAGTVAGQPPDAGAAGEAGSAGAACVYPTPVTYPGTCFDNKISGKETGIDCGGPTCPPCFTANQGCVVESDCSSGECVNGLCNQTLRVSYMSLDANATTPAPKFKLRIEYLSPVSAGLQDIRLRYFFKHDGVVEPVIATDTQATFDSIEFTDQVRWNIHRLPAAPGDFRNLSSDSYLEISFTSNATLVRGSAVELTQTIVAGSPVPVFSQSGHYSFREVGVLSENPFVTLYRGGDRLWGIEPPLTVIPDCAFSAAVNLGGPALTAAGVPFQGSADARVSFPGTVFSSSSALPFPVADNSTTKLLSTAFVLNANEASWPVNNGKYWAYAWLTSAASSDRGTLAIQDNVGDKFQGTQMSSSSEWAQVGPYPVDVLNRSLKVSTTFNGGTVNVAGVALFTRAR